MAPKFQIFKFPALPFFTCFSSDWPLISHTMRSQTSVCRPTTRSTCQVDPLRCCPLQTARKSSIRQRPLPAVSMFSLATCGASGGSRLFMQIKMLFPHQVQYLTSPTGGTCLSTSNPSSAVSVKSTRPPEVVTFFIPASRTAVNSTTNLSRP